MRIQVPEDVKYIIEKLNSAGYEAYAVGGCIRDSILGRTPDDWDITTSAKPEEIKELFPKTIDTGIQHGTVTVMRNHIGYEVTTYRIDGEYEDSRHPKEVVFTSDFTTGFGLTSSAFTSSGMITSSFFTFLGAGFFSSFFGSGFGSGFTSSALVSFAFSA